MPKRKPPSRAALLRIATLAELLVDALTLDLIEPQYGFRKMIVEELRAIGRKPRDAVMTDAERNRAETYAYERQRAARRRGCR